jgi:hypothetical protein
MDVQTTMNQMFGAMAAGNQAVSDNAEINRLRSALKELIDLCEWCAVFESRDVEPHELDAIVDDTLARARKALGGSK